MFGKYYYGNLFTRRISQKNIFMEIIIYVLINTSEI